MQEAGTDAQVLAVSTQKGSLTMTLTIEDALNIVGLATQTEIADVDVRRLQHASACLARYVLDHQQDHERAYARGMAAAQRRLTKRHVTGHALLLTTDAGGFRHRLARRPVHAGTGLWLLTPIGWLPGRYEWNWRPPALPGFHFSLPGVSEEMVLPLVPGARLAWPDEFDE